MNKKNPLHEMLHVDPAERWYVEGYGWFTVDEDGYCYDADTHNPIDSPLLIRLIQDPFLITHLIRHTRWTTKDYDSAKAVKILFPNATDVMRNDASTVYILQEETAIIPILGHQFPCLTETDGPVSINAIIAACE